MTKFSKTTSSDYIMVLINSSLIRLLGYFLVVLVVVCDDDTYSHGANTDLRQMLSVLFHLTSISPGMYLHYLWIIMTIWKSNHKNKCS